MSISRDKSGTRYHVQISLKKRTFFMGFYDTCEAAEAAHNAAKEAKRNGMGALERHHAKYSNTKNSSKLRPKRDGKQAEELVVISYADTKLREMVTRYSYLTARQLSIMAQQDISLSLDRLVSNGVIKKEGNLYYAT